ncbi:MAG: hypothetical protein RLO80_09000 [Hyphomonas sp.]
MMRHFLALGLVSLALAAPAHASDAAACKAMKAALAPREAEISDLKAKRDASAELTETAGEAWDEVEVHRLMSSGHAAQADSGKAAYEEARRQLARDEMALQATLKQYNADVAVFNARCTSKK